MRISSTSYQATFMHSWTRATLLLLFHISFDRVSCGPAVEWGRALLGQRPHRTTMMLDQPELSTSNQYLNDSTDLSRTLPTPDYLTDVQFNVDDFNDYLHNDHIMDNVDYDDSFFEWEEDDDFCYPLDTNWYTNEDFSTNRVVCWDDDEIYDDDFDYSDDYFREWTGDVMFDDEDFGFFEWQLDEMDDEYLMLDDEEDEDSRTPIDKDYWKHVQDPLRYMSRDEADQYYSSVHDQPHFLLPRSIQPGQVEPLRWRDTLEFVNDDEIFVVGLPQELLQEFRAYFNTTGILDVVDQLLYPQQDDSKRPLYRRSAKTKQQLWTLADGHTWNARRADHWPTDMVWFDPADEACYERLNEILRRGNFEVVMKALREQLGQPDLVIHGNGAIFVSHFDADPDVELAQIHRDVPDTRGAFYNILVPIYLPEAAGEDASLHVGGVHEDRCAPVNLQYHVATVIGSDSLHGTGECDFRASKGFRLSMSIWVSEITETNLEVIAKDNYSPWPINDHKDWFRAQRGRNLTNDVGRAPISVNNKRTDCDVVKNQCDHWRVRTDCAQACGLYMETQEYYTNLQALKSMNSFIA
jgi:hypothetical protein